jgi:hypothetical protein
VSLSPAIAFCAVTDSKVSASTGTIVILLIDWIKGVSTSVGQPPALKRNDFSMDLAGN